MKTYLIRCKSNLHAGSGDNNFGVVDNLVQRDVTTEYPTINSSSLKGALREHFTQKLNKNVINHIFGSDDNNNPSSGKFKFFPANLLAIPARSSNKAYHLALCPSTLKEFIETVSHNKDLEIELKNLLNISKLPCVFDQKDKGDIEGINIEEVSTHEISKLKELLNNNSLVLMKDEEFKNICSSLPVIARNCLENGISQNLWYEEVVPRETVFSFSIYHNSNDDQPEFFKILKEDLIQIGANASIGYGFCEIKEVEG